MGKDVKKAVKKVKNLLNEKAGAPAWMDPEVAYAEKHSFLQAAQQPAAWLPWTTEESNTNLLNKPEVQDKKEVKEEVKKEVKEEVKKEVKKEIKKVVEEEEV